MLSTILQILKSIPQIIGAIKALIAFWWTVKNGFEQKKNDSIRKDMENAETEKERQAALDRAAGKFNS